MHISIGDWSLEGSEAGSGRVVIVGRVRGGAG